MPPEALRAWYNLLFCVLFWSPKTMRLCQHHANKCRHYLRKTHVKLMRNPVAKKIQDTEAMLPTGLLTHILRRVTLDFCNGQPDIVYSYWEHYNQLVRLSNPFRLSELIVSIHRRSSNPPRTRSVVGTT